MFHLLHFLNKWCNDGMKNSINDLSYLDNELFKNLMKLTKMTNDELKQLELTFSINLKLIINLTTLTYYQMGLTLKLICPTF